MFVCFASEFAKGFTRPIQPGSVPQFVPDKLANARDTLIVKRKLNLILRSNSDSEIYVRIGDIVQLFINILQEERKS